MKPKQPDELPVDVAFFSAGGLSEKTDGLEIIICFDYELARESNEVANIVQKLPKPEQTVERLLKQPHVARWAGSGGIRYRSGHEEDPLVTGNFTTPLKARSEQGTVDDVILQLVDEGFSSASDIAVEMNISKRIVRQRAAWLIEAGRLEKSGRGYRLASPEVPRPSHGTEQREDGLDTPLIPTICLAAAKWFPKPWLTIPADDRKKLVERFAFVYSSFKALSISEGHDSSERAALYAKAVASDNARGHHFKVYTMYLDWSEPTTRLKERFASWLKVHEQQGVAKRSNRGHHKPAEWLWALASYRLAKLPIPKRDVLGSMLGKKMSDSKISRGKKRILKLMKFRRYLR